MATMILTATIGSGTLISFGNQKNDVAQASTVKTDVAAIDYTAVAADIATLVADGATPTQAHVTTLNTDWGTLKALIDTAVTDAAKLSGGAPDALIYLLSTNLTKNKLLAILRQWQSQIIDGTNFLSS